MHYKKGKDRSSLLASISIEELIGSEAVVRLIDLFVDSLDLGSLGFRTDYPCKGRPPYHHATLLKLFIYGYLNEIRSSRKLEKATKLNLEVIWLLGKLEPDHNTISNFRRDNATAIKAVFQEAVGVAMHFDLIGKKLLAGDGTTMRGQNSKKNNYTQKKIDRHLTYIENKVKEYLDALASADGEKKKELEVKLKVKEEQKKKYELLEKQLKESGESQISTSDPATRLLVKGNTSIVGYNIQSMVDAKHNIPIDYEVTNETDSKAMGEMLERSIEVLELEKDEEGKIKEELKGLFDTGYHNGEEIEKAEKQGVTTYVCVPKPHQRKGLSPKYNLSEFKYKNKEDVYVCPEGQILVTKGVWTKTSSGSLVKTYRTKSCADCPVRDKCTKAKIGRTIKRNEYAESYERNKENMASDPDLYRQRQAIVEHPFGTLKRSWGFGYIITKKGKDRASADVGLMFLAYSLLRIFNILAFEVLEKHFLILKKALFYLFCLLGSMRSHKLDFKPFF